MRRRASLRARWAAGTAISLVLGVASGAHAQGGSGSAEEIRRLRAAIDLRAVQLAQEKALAEQQRRLDEQQQRLADQQRLLDELSARLRAQARELDALRPGRIDGPAQLAAADLERARGAGPAATAASQAAVPSAAAAAAPQTPPQTPPQGAPAGAAAPPQPVGEAPPEEKPVPVEALPEGAGVLTPPGTFIVEPSFDFSHGSSDRLVFRGIEIVPGVQIGVIEANDADRDTLSAALAFRYGLTNRLEVETRVPYLYRKDRITTIQQRDEAVTRTVELDGSDIGDIEVSARYQLTNGGGGRWPVLVGGLRVKMDTGMGPFEVDRDQFGVATELATGSGFWAVEPSVSFLFPSDPAVIFGSLSYMAHLAEDIDQDFGDGVFVGRVDPGDSINASIGFGFALNDRFSYSLGYRHSYIFETDTELNGQTYGSNEVQVGVMTFGMSYALARNYSLNASFDIGVTEDAPDVRISVRMPFRF